MKKPGSQARMTASTTPITTASVMALGFAERSNFDVSVVPDFIVVFLLAAPKKRRAALEDAEDRPPPRRRGGAA